MEKLSVSQDNSIPMIAKQIDKQMKRYRITCDSYQRGLKRGSHKVQTPRLLKIFLGCVIPSRRGYSKFKNKVEARRIPPRTIEILNNGTTITNTKHGYFFTLEGYLNPTGLDLLMVFIDDAISKNMRGLEYKAYDLIKALDIAKHGGAYDTIFEQVNKIANIGIVFSDKIWSESKLKRSVRSKLQFVYLVSAEIEETENPKFKGQIDRIIRVELSKDFFESIQKFFALVDWDLYKEIKNPSAKLLYLHLRLNDYGHNTSYVSIKDLFRSLNLTLDSHYKRKLRAIVKEIEEVTKETVKVDFHKDEKRLLIKYKDQAELTPGNAKKLSTKR